MKKNIVELTFIIHDFNDIGHQELTNMIGVTPTLMAIKGNKRIPQNPHSALFKQNSWGMDAGLKENSSFSDQMNKILDVIESKMEIFEVICSKYVCEFSCSIFVYYKNGESTPWIHLDDRYNRINKILNIEFDIDLYVRSAK